MINNDAYTLIEILICIVIFTSLFFLLSPNMTKVNDLIIKIELKTLIRDIKYYKNKSINENKSYSFNLDPGQNSYFFTTSIDYKIVRIYEKKFHKSIKILGNNFNDLINFNTSSRPTNAGSLYLKCNGQDKTLTISPITANVNIIDNKKLGGVR